MVWIHGGAFQVGGSALPYFDGRAFAKQGVVLVSFNYRLGKLGFFAHPLIVAGAGDEPVGNYGLMDQIAALKWVRANIAAFGGDPHNVTAFGESAGGASLLFLLTSPAATGLFDKAIVESGGGWQPATPLAVQERQDEAALAQRFGHGFTDAAQLRALSVDDLLSLPRSGLRGPFVDGRVVTRSPRAAIAAGAAADIPMIIGTNTDEARPLMRRLGSDPQVVLRQLDGAGEAIYADEGATPAVKARRVYTDAAFTAPARWVAARTAGGAPTWLYSFSYVPQALRRPDEGASHGAEIPFVFDSWDRIDGAAAFLTPQDKAYAQTMNRCWASFAKTGTPQCAGQDWPRYTPQDDALMQFDDRPHVVTGFRRPMLDWQETHTAKVVRARPR
jgi:para-nitrobenzyl esterase